MLHADNTEVGTYTEKVKEDITTIDHGCHFCQGIFDLQSSVFKYIFYFQRKRRQSYMRMTLRLEQIQKKQRG